MSTDENGSNIKSDRTKAIGKARQAKKASKKIERLIDWNVDVLSKLLRQIVALRRVVAKEERLLEDWPTKFAENNFETNIPFDEVKEVISIPAYNDAIGLAETDGETEYLSETVQMQLRDFVSKIVSDLVVFICLQPFLKSCQAVMYNENFFHCFEHASHVVMSVTKLLSRIVAPSDVLDYMEGTNIELVQTLHDFTFGIFSDPLTQFAVVFSALIHDCDHSGVPNAQLMHENADLANRYHGKSMAEQNSIDLAWALLTKESYNELRLAICGTLDELKRFRQLLINAVLATDLADKGKNVSV